MTLDGFWEVFGVGFFGGALLELYKWYTLRESPNLPLYARMARYWVITIGMALAGGGLAVLYGTADVQAVLALNIGLSAPAIIRTVAASPPEDVIMSDGTRRGRPVDAPSLRRFLAGR